MATPLTLTTELEAINQMLFAIGEAPVNAVNNGNVDSAVAQSTLRNVSREVQQKGWHWNTDEGFKLLPDADNGNITLPANTLKVDTTGDSMSLDLVQRGLRLYDRVNHTYAFTTSVTVDLVAFLPFEELPEAARNYITLRAARRFQQNTVGSAELSGFGETDELRALVDLQNAEADSADLRMVQDADLHRNVFQ